MCVCECMLYGNRRSVVYFKDIISIIGTELPPTLLLLLRLWLLLFFISIHSILFIPPPSRSSRSLWTAVNGISCSMHACVYTILLNKRYFIGAGHRIHFPPLNQANDSKCYKFHTATYLSNCWCMLRRNRYRWHRSYTGKSMGHNCCLDSKNLIKKLKSDGVTPCMGYIYIHTCSVLAISNGFSQLNMIDFNYFACYWFLCLLFLSTVSRSKCKTSKSMSQGFQLKTAAHLEVSFQFCTFL